MLCMSNNHSVISVFQWIYICVHDLKLFHKYIFNKTFDSFEISRFCDKKNLKKLIILKDVNKIDFA